MKGIYIREFTERDISFKVNLINDSKNNKYLHYDLPLTIDKTYTWFENNKNKKNRYDAVILKNDNRVGIIGLLNIKDRKGEYYITLSVRGDNVAQKATFLLFDIAKKNYGLNEIYLYTEEDNIVAQKLFEKVGFKNKQLIESNSFKGKKKRYYYDKRL